MNLLEDDDDEDIDEGPIDSRYDKSPEIEPLVSIYFAINMPLQYTVIFAPSKKKRQTIF